MLLTHFLHILLCTLQVLVTELHKKTCRRHLRTVLFFSVADLLISLTRALRRSVYYEKWVIYQPGGYFQRVPDHARACGTAFCRSSSTSSRFDRATMMGVIDLWEPAAGSWFPGASPSSYNNSSRKLAISSDAVAAKTRSKYTVCPKLTLPTLLSYLTTDLP